MLFTDRNGIDRRYFLKQSGLAVVGLTAVEAFGLGKASGKMICIILDPDDEVASSNPVSWAVSQLQESLNGHGITARIYPVVDKAPSTELTIIVAGSKNALAQKILKSNKVSVPNAPESLALAQGNISGKKVLLACGTDARGLGYAVLELADRVQYCDDPLASLEVDEPIVEKPANVIRSIYRCFTSEVEDKSWFYDREFWKEYLSMLATNRINRFSLSLGMGYNTPRRIKDSYFFFAYPFLVSVPGYNVRAVGLSNAERKRNLEMLKFISDETAARGIDFQLALWSHGADWPDSDDVNYPLTGLDDENHAAYCRDGLVEILKACPSISGTTFRVHSESGVPHGSDDFWRVLFQAHGLSGRKVEIDMHGKQITQSQIDIALATGMAVNVSPKYWGEQMGLAYHQGDIRRHEKAKVEFKEEASGVGLDSRKYTRYGYGDLMPEDRRWGILHRIWPGTQRLLLSGDPALSAGYGRVSSFCGSLGVERLDPLNFKGRQGSGHPGGRCAYADKSLNPEYDFQKFLYTYRLWGRLTYNPDTDPEVWRRYLRREFQGAAEPIEKALSMATRVLMLITTAHGPSADCQVYWPEIYINQPIVNPGRSNYYRDTFEPKTFGNVSPFDPQLFSSIDEFTDELLQGQRLQKYSPLEVAQWLEDMAVSASQNLSKAQSLVGDKNAPTWRRLWADVTIQAGIALFFAHKIRSAVLWRIYSKSGDRTALTEAIDAYKKARKAWADMAEGAKAIYVLDISFGNNPNIRGHWIDRLGEIDGDIDDMQKKPGENRSGNNAKVEPNIIRRAIREVNKPQQRIFATCRHTPAKIFHPGKPISIDLETDDPSIRSANLYYRRVNQAIDWQMQPMKIRKGRYMATIPADYTETRYPMEYYFGIDLGNAGQAIYPGLDPNLSNMPYFVLRQIERICITK
jgi:hypothetical protein